LVIVNYFFVKKIMASSLDIKRRIRSINSTKKITRAMEMVSAAKMRRAVASVIGIRPYAISAWQVLANLAQTFQSTNQGLLEVREVRRVLCVVVTSNRGLCGSFNAQIGKKIKEELANPGKLCVNRIGNKKLVAPDCLDNLVMDFLTIGRKGEGIVKRFEKTIVAAFPELINAPTIEALKPLTNIVIEEYLKKNYDKVVVIYTDYISTINQKTKIRQLLPISKLDIEKQISEMDTLAKDLGVIESLGDYKIEPNPEVVLEHIIPRLLEMQLLHACLESNAAEHSARMMAMKNATDAAKEMSADLTLAYNQIRQGKITQEIAEISAGRAALE
jgi:F-type H+-transporting ATPase subunit gamma